MLIVDPHNHFIWTENAANLVLTGADMPQPGQSFLQSTTLNPMPDSTGPNFVWNFTAFSPDSQASVAYVAGTKSVFAQDILLLPILLSRYGRAQGSLPAVVNSLLTQQVGFTID